MPASYVKDPDATLDYEIDWTGWLETAETITASTWIIPDGLTLDPSHPSLSIHTDTSATVWLTGGTVGTRYVVTNRVTSSGGRTDDRSIKVTVLDR